MKKATITISLIITISILLANAHTKPSMAARAIGLSANNDIQAVQSEQTVSNGSEQEILSPDLSCANPIPAMVATCQAIEAEILASTVRILMYTPLMHVEGFGVRIINGMGHATIKDGRYLITHNHYDKTIFSMLGQGDPEDLITIDIFDTNGQVILQVPGQTLSVLVVDHETVVFDFGKEDGLGFFAAHGLPSAKFMAQPPMPIKPGMEVAQIDWDGSSSHIDWITINAITTLSDTPTVQLSNCIKTGASGGGVFWQGVHIGNNWSRTAQCDQGISSESAPHTSVALNSQLVIAP